MNVLNFVGGKRFGVCSSLSVLAAVSALWA